MKYPFSPEVLDALPEELAELFRSLETTLLEEICSRLKVAGEFNQVTLQDIKALRALGVDLKAIEKAISTATGTAQEKLEELINDVVARNQSYYEEVIDLAELTKPERLVNESDIEAIRRQTKAEFVNLTQSMGFIVTQGAKKVKLEPAKAYQWALDKAETQIQSGAISYSEAIKNAVKELAESGIKTVSWESGHVDQVDVSVRRAVMTGINQICQRYSEQSAEYLETDIVEISAHQGARDTGEGPANHKSWQGKVYQWREKAKAINTVYQGFTETTGYGTGEGLGGWNCRHHFTPFVEGVMYRTFSDEDLEKIDPPPFEYQGKTYTAYEATQQQRKIERTIRKLKREQAAYKAAAAAPAYTAVTARLRRLQKQYKSFSAAAKLPMQSERTKILY